MSHGVIERLSCGKALWQFLGQNLGPSLTFILSCLVLGGHHAPISTSKISLRSTSSPSALLLSSALYHFYLDKCGGLLGILPAGLWGPLQTLSAGSQRGIMGHITVFFF